ncbi:MAG: pyruvate dehydrogenase component, partial [Actinomycetota bacterium]
RLDEEDLDSFRREIGREGRGLSSYPHPRLMPDFWEFPTVSMGLGPLTALYHARFNRYLLNRKIDDTSASRVWAFLGDGECDEPETLGSISLAAREQLDNLVFVVNCNLQRLDGPVRGNGKIIQELEATFRGAGWNVIKVIWGSKWDELLARDTSGVLLNKMNTTVDGEFQRYTVEDGNYIRENFFGPDPRLREMVSHLSDLDLQNLPRGGHDYRKLYAAYRVKGWTLGDDIEGRNATHQIKKMTDAQLKTLRDRLHLNDEISDAALEADEPPYYRPPVDSVEYQYMVERRRALGGAVPRRSTAVRKAITMPSDDAFTEFENGSAAQSVSTTMGFTRLLRNLARDKDFGERVVPIIPDEARTFGMDSLFRELKIYASQGQKYEPVDHDMLLKYAEASDGQILEEGITEAGSLASFIAAGTSYATRGVPMVPFYTFYSMFGFQRVGDLIWQAADARARGFLLGATAGRTTLHGEGLQHQDGHSLILASTVPACRAYDPAFAYEVATIVREGTHEMYGETQSDVFFYLTLYNENYLMPAMPKSATITQEIMQGIYLWKPAPSAKHRATILFSGSTHTAASVAADELLEKYGVGCELWSATSYKTLREEAMDAERWSRLHPEQNPRQPLVTRLLNDGDGPIVAVSDFMRIVPEQVARFVPKRRFTPLGTDGMGRSDTRAALRRHFEIDAPHIVVTVLHNLAQSGAIKSDVVTEAIKRHGLNPEVAFSLHQ